MKAVAVLLCLIGSSLSLPLIPRRIYSASASNELLLALGLSNAGLLPPQLQGRVLPGIFQQPQIPGLPQVSFGPRGPFAAQLPNQVAFPGQPPLPQNPGQGAQQNQQAQQQDPMNPQMPQQGQQPNQNTPFINQRAFVPQQAAPVVPGAQQQQQQMANDPSSGAAATTQTVPFGGVMPQFNGDRMNFANAHSGALMLPSTPVTPSIDALASSPDPTVNSSYMKNKANLNPFMEP